MRTFYIRCEMQNIISKDAWANWDNTNTAAKCFFREYKCTGAGASITRMQLTDSEYLSVYSSPEKILGFTPVMK